MGFKTSFWLLLAADWLCASPLWKKGENNAAWQTAENSDFIAHFLNPHHDGAGHSALPDSAPARL
ncbi:hypothetical protein FAI40_04485 [Acetobacteraceae bacterium]|nr:hypothetical protein FAI40_04485 [Acetobacteraceae bacterium]